MSARRVVAGGQPCSAGCSCLGACVAAAGTTDGQPVPISVSERGLNVTALCVFGVPLVGLAGVVGAYQFFWGAGDELLMLAVVGALLMVNAAALRPLQHRLVDLMSVDFNLATEAESADKLNKRIRNV